MAELTIEQLAQGKANQAATCEQDVIVPQDATHEGGPRGFPLMVNVGSSQDPSSTERATSQKPPSTVFYILWFALLTAQCVILTLVVSVGLGIVLWYTNWLKFTSRNP